MKAIIVLFCMFLATPAYADFGPKLCGPAAVIAGAIGQWRVNGIPKSMIVDMIGADYQELVDVIYVMRPDNHAEFVSDIARLFYDGCTEELRK